MTRASQLLAIAALLAGCAPLYPVQIAPLGNDTYIATQTSLSSWLDARAAALQCAAAWCERKGGTFAAVDGDQQRVAFGVESHDHASVTLYLRGSDEVATTLPATAWLLPSGLGMMEWCRINIARQPPLRLS